METFSCMAFHDWERTQTIKVKDKITLLDASLTKRAWWNSVMDAYHVMMPIMNVIRNLDARAPKLGRYGCNGG